MISVIDLDVVRRYCNSVRQVATEAALSADPRVTFLALHLRRTAREDIDQLIHRIAYRSR